MKRIYYLAFFLAILFSPLAMYAQLGQQGHKYPTFSKDGAWCWFSDPRAIYLHGDNKGVISGWVKTDGSIETGLLNLKDSAVILQNINPQFEEDDHDNPAFVELSDLSYMTFYAKHGWGPIYLNHADEQDGKLFKSFEKVWPITDKVLEKYPRKTITYANPFTLSKEKNRLFVFGRWTGYKPNMIWSDDNGKTFTDAKVFISNFPFDKGNRPYVKYYSDGKDKIHIVFTDGHPRNEPTNSVYYAYYQKGAFWKANGKKICDLDQLPFEPKDATVIYQATEETGRSWVYDIGTDEQDRPVVLYARYPNEHTHIYHYAHFDGKKWQDTKLCNAGKWFPHTIEDGWEREPHYSGGLTINPLNPFEVYVSKEVKNVFEIVKYTSINKGVTWEEIAVTVNSKNDNVRPYFPRNIKKGDRPVLLWMENEVYVHYTAYKCNIKYCFLK